MSNRNYTLPKFDRQWAETRETNMAVATAIHAISDKARTPDQIWNSPTQAEWDHVVMAVAEYVEHGDFPAEDDGRYAWGCESIVLG